MKSTTAEFDPTPPAGFWDKVRANLHRVPFMEDAIAAYYCAIDPATPVAVKAARWHTSSCRSA